MRRRWRLQRPDASWFFFMAGAAAGSVWVYDALTGRTSDGALPGIMTGTWAIWAALKRDSTRREDRGDRDDSQRISPPRRQRLYDQESEDP